MNRAQPILAELRAAGAVVRAVGDKLHIDAPKGTLSPALLDRIKASKADMLAALKTQPAGRLPVRCPAGLRMAVEAVQQTFADMGGATLVSMTTSPNEARQRAGAAIRQARRRGQRDRAIALRDSWAERLAVCTVAGGLNQSEAERTAAEEVEQADTG